MPNIPRNTPSRRRAPTIRTVRSTAPRRGRVRRYAPRFIGAFLLALLLSACGNFVPDQSVPNPLGLDQMPLSVTFGGAAAALQPLAVSGNAGGTFSFDDFDRSLPLSPAALETEIGLAAALLEDPDGPRTITLTRIDLQLRVWHGAPDYDAADPSGRATANLSTQGQVVLRRDACTAAGCAYEVEDVVLGTIDLVGAQLSSFVQVVTNAPSPNEGEVTLVVEAEEDELAGATLNFVLDAAQGTLKF